jgi:hypothetical protein
LRVEHNQTASASARFLDKEDVKAAEALTGDSHARSRLSRGSNAALLARSHLSGESAQAMFGSMNCSRPAMRHGGELDKEEEEYENKLSSICGQSKR